MKNTPPFAFDHSSGELLHGLPCGEYLTFPEIRKEKGVISKGVPTKHTLINGQYTVVFNIKDIKGIAPRYDPQKTAKQQRGLQEQMLESVGKYLQKENKTIPALLPAKDRNGEQYLSTVVKALAYEDKEIAKLEPSVKEMTMDACAKRTLSRFGIGKNTYDLQLPSSISKEDRKVIETLSSSFSNRIADNFNLHRFKAMDSPMSKDYMAIDELDKINNGVPENARLKPAEFIERAKLGLKEGYRREDIRHAKMSSLPKGFFHWRGQNWTKGDLNRVINKINDGMAKDVQAKTNWKRDFSQNHNYGYYLQKGNIEYNYRFSDPCHPKQGELFKVDYNQPDDKLTLSVEERREIANDLDQLLGTVEAYSIDSRLMNYPSNEQMDKALQEAERARELDPLCNKSTYQKEVEARINRVHDEEMIRDMVTIGTVAVTIDEIDKMADQGYLLLPQAQDSLEAKGYDISRNEEGVFSVSKYLDQLDQYIQCDFDGPLTGDAVRSQMDEQVERTLSSMDDSVALSPFDFRERSASEYDGDKFIAQQGYEELAQDLDNLNAEYGDFRLPTWPGKAAQELGNFAVKELERIEF